MSTENNISVRTPIVLVTNRDPGCSRCSGTIVLIDRKLKRWFASPTGTDATDSWVINAKMMDSKAVFKIFNAFETSCRILRN